MAVSQKQLKNFNEPFMKYHCPLCSTPADTFFKDSKHHFLICPKCQGIFRDPNQFLSPRNEKERYLHHRNDMEDTGYYQFVLPIINQVKLHMTQGTKGLDFGCGHTPVLSNYLIKEGYDMFVFDPIFFKDDSLMNDQYDFIVCCEVIEHFYHPSQEFQNLFQTLRAKGKLICKTHLFEEGIDFDTWYYKNDPSHVFIYQAETMLWIKNNYLLKDVKINKRVITFTK